MTIPTQDTSRTARLLALMKKGDDAFNARDFAAVDEVHHPGMVAYITGLAEPVYGKEAHATAMQQMLRMFPAGRGPLPDDLRAALTKITRLSRLCGEVFPGRDDGAVNNGPNTASKLASEAASGSVVPGNIGGNPFHRRGGPGCRGRQDDGCWRVERGCQAAQAARRRTSQMVAAMSSTDSASSQPPSIHWKAQNRLPG